MRTKQWSSEEEEKKKRHEEYMKHKCRRCHYATWQQEAIVLCLLPRCIKEGNR